MPPHNSLARPEPLTAVIPAYNEERRIGRVLSVLAAMDAFAQILVVDDGSQDDTAAVALSFNKTDPRIQLLRLSANCGKGGAMVAGVAASRHDLILFLDADLLNLHPHHIEKLIEPVRSGRCQMALAHFRNGRYLTHWAHNTFPLLSGQRCLRWSLFRDTPDMANARWGIEVALSFHAWRCHYTVASVDWPGVSHTMRLTKLNWWRGSLTHIQMWADIGKYLIRQLTSPVLGRPTPAKGRLTIQERNTG